VTDTARLSGYVRSVDDTAGNRKADAAAQEARVSTRLRRIEALDRERAPAGQVLDELRELVREAEALAGCEGEGRARPAVGTVREGVEGMS
jgi:hypothetical protein